MKISSSGILNGFIDDIYGKRGKSLSGMPITSLPLSIKGFPPETKSLALIMDDPDAIPVAGFSWIHWLACNIHQAELHENSSQTQPDYIQGKNSWGQDCYGGPAPPNKRHCYQITVYALSQDLDLKNGYSHSEFLNLIKKSPEIILDTAVLKGYYDC